MLVNKCYLKDIREYEENTNTNILRLFDKVSVLNIVKLLQVFYRELSEDDALVMLDEYCDIENKSIVDVIVELRDALLGYKYIENNDVYNEDLAGTVEDVNTYSTLTDFYMHLGMQLMSLGVTYNEFWSLTTKEMYQLFNSIQQKIIIDFNKDMQINHINAGMIGAAVHGLLPKDAPQIDINEMNNNNKEEIIINHSKYGEISLADLENIKVLERLQ